ncbi:NUDIX domain-containing protein [Nocardioides sp. TRM66260-LWL]|nr:NUDIX domain-containing protein [Nocardioides sp. TRM66260-LWL]
MVVGAALLRGGRVLAARRVGPPALAGRWELPGGKVEPGEEPAAALRRELREELGVDVEVEGWLATRVDLGAGRTLRVGVVRARGSAEPEADGVSHDALRWLGPDELSGPDAPAWLESDTAFLPELLVLLRAEAAGWRRAVLFEDDDARGVAERLRADGYEALLERERLAGEDDDEDQPWAVVTDAPVLLLELLLDEVDGWLVDDAPAPAPRPALPLPDAPRRLKRPPLG